MGKRRQKRKVASNGRNLERVGRQGAFILLRHSIWHSPNVSALSPTARCLMVELQSLFNGRNNGKLFLSIRDAADRLGFSDLQAAASAFHELVAVGLIRCEIEGYFTVKTGTGSRARAWRLEWLGDEGERPSAECLQTMDGRMRERIGCRGRKRLERRQRALKRYEKSKTAVVDSISLAARSAEISVRSVLDSTAQSDENVGKLPSCFVRDSITHLDNHSGYGEPDPSGWWVSIQANINRVAAIHS